MNYFRWLIYRMTSCHVFTKKNSPFIIGICIGIAISLIQTPFMQKDCQKIANHQIGKRMISQRELQQSNGNHPIEESSDDYEPLVRLDTNEEINAKENVKKTKLVRPRYYSTELGMRNKVLVSVISTKESIKTFGVSMNKTLNHFVDKVIFFIDGTGNKKFGLNIPIVGFKEAKPLIKLFRVLSYINENYLADFDYFFFAMDHTYINGQRLMHMLERISVNNNIHMGLPVQYDDSLYCSLDNGILLSHSVLEAVVRDLSWCTRNAFSDLDSDNFGRCILHASNIPCQTTFKNHCFESYSLKNTVNIKQYLETYDQTPAVKKALTVAHVPKASDMYRLHVFYLKEFVIETREEISEIRKNIERTIKASPLNITLPWPIGSPPPHDPTSRHDIINWESFNATHMFMPNDFTNVQKLSGVDLMDIMNVVNSSVAHLNAKYPQLKFSEIRYGHRRYDPTRGMDYLIALDFIGESGDIVHKKIEGYRGLTMPEIIPMPYVTENSKLTTLIFAEKSDSADLNSFFERLIQRVKISQLTVMFCLLYEEGDAFTGNDDPFEKIKSNAKDFSNNYYESQSRGSYIQITVPKGRRPSDIALVDVALKEISREVLVYITDINAFFDTTFINRVRMNSIRNKQMFSPIPFTLYHPKAVSNTASYNKKQIAASNGRFDTYYYSQGSFYVEDYFAARAKMKSLPLYKSVKDFARDNQLSRETNIYDVFDSDTRILILRAVDPNLLLTYTAVVCPEAVGPNKSDKQQECETRQALSMGTKQMLSKLVFEHKEKAESKKKVESEKKV